MPGTSGPHAPGWSAAGFDRILVDAPCSSERHFVHGACATARANLCPPRALPPDYPVPSLLTIPWCDVAQVRPTPSGRARV